MREREGAGVVSTYTVNICRIYINFLKSYPCAVMTAERRNGLNITFDNEREREREKII